MKDRISIYSATGHATHWVHQNPKPIAVSAELISGGGGGMGSRPNMSFSSADIAEAYSMYGGKVGPGGFNGGRGGHPMLKITERFV